MVVPYAPEGFYFPQNRALYVNKYLLNGKKEGLILQSSQPTKYSIVKQCYDEKIYLTTSYYELRYLLCPPLPNISHESVGQEHPRLQVQGLNTKEWQRRPGALPYTDIRARAKRPKSLSEASGYDRNSTGLVGAEA